MHALDNWAKERNAAWLYRALSDLESGTARQLLFLEFASDADQQADLWAGEARKAGIAPPAFTPAAHVRLAGWLANKLGERKVRWLLAAMKVRGLSVHSIGFPAGQSLAASPAIAISIEMRAAVYGMHDGLIAITLLITGVAGATKTSMAVLLTGVAGLLAGACATAAGEWMAGREKHRLAEYPVQTVRDALAAIYQGRGLPYDEALSLASSRMAADLESGPEAMEADPPNRHPPGKAAGPQVVVIAFFGFIFGGAIPLAPYLMDIPRHTLLIASCLSCMALFVSGAAVSRIAGRRALWGGFRLVALVGMAGGASYITGGLLGAGTG